MYEFIIEQSDADLILHACLGLFARALKAPRRKSDSQLVEPVRFDAITHVAIRAVMLACCDWARAPDRQHWR